MIFLSSGEEQATLLVEQYGDYQEPKHLKPQEGREDPLVLYATRPEQVVAIVSSTGNSVH